MGIFDFFRKPQAVTSKPAQINNHSIKAFISSNDRALNELLRKVLPSAQGLYPHEILMLFKAEDYKTSDNGFPLWWESRYCVSDPQKILAYLHENGFTDIGDLKATINKLTMPQIKAELRLTGQKTTGKKAELVDRLLANTDPNTLAQKFPQRYFVLTDKGRTELEQNQYVLYQHNHWQYLSIFEMNVRLINNPANLNYKEIQWEQLQKDASYHRANNQFRFYCNDVSLMSSPPKARPVSELYPCRKHSWRS